MGISGNIGLIDSIRMTKGKNLVDPSSKIKWYSGVVYTWNYYEKKYE
jgi:hypothetical protein